MSLHIAESLSQVHHSWAGFKTRYASATYRLRVHTDEFQHTVYFYDEPEVHLAFLALGSSDALDYEASYAQLVDEKPLAKRDELGRPVFIREPRLGQETIYTSHNLADPCSWFGDSVRVTEEVLTLPLLGDGTTWNSTHTNWIDMVSGRVQDDDGHVAEQKVLNPGNPHGYQVVVTVNGVEKTMREPFEESGGDYEVRWAEGQIVFFTTVGTGAEVKASYSYANGSTFYLRPLPGKYLNIEAAESDFSEDTYLTDTIVYAAFGYVEVFAPQYAYTPSTGSATFTGASTAVTGVGTAFTTEVTPGQYIRLEAHGPEAYMVVATIESDTALTLAAPYAGASGSGVMAIADTYTGVYPVGTKIELSKGLYKRIVQIFNEAIGSYPQMTILSSTSGERAASNSDFWRTSRGLKSPIQSIPFRYATTRDLDATKGMELRVWNKHHRPQGGFFSSLTLYCTSRDADA